MVKAKKEASRRTKNKLKNHPDLSVVRVEKSVHCFNGEAGILCESKGEMFWLPENEVEERLEG